MVIQIDSREKPKAIQGIIEEFDRQGIVHPVSKLWIGDYMNYDNPRLVVDRKQNLIEVVSNVTQDHERFRNEMLRAQQNGIKIVFLVEHGDGIECLEDIIFWENPRLHKVKTINGKRIEYTTKATTGETLYNILRTIMRKYGVEFRFCDKAETGRKIVEILTGGDG